MSVGVQLHSIAPQSIKHLQRKTSNVQGLTHLGHEHKAPDSKPHNQ
jgi:hypothetical protein